MAYSAGCMPYFINPLCKKNLMKHLFLSLIIVLTTIVSSVDASAQVYSKMPEKKRNSALIKVARKFYKNPKFTY